MSLSASVRLRCRQHRSFMSIVAPVFAATLLAATVHAGDVSPPSWRPPGLQPTEVNISRDRKLRYGEPQVVVNPHNPNNVVAVAAATEFTYACKAASEQKCEIVTSGGFTQPYGIVNNLPAFTRVVAFASFDRGKHWRRVPLPQRPSTHPDLAEPGHPTATVGPDGTFYIAWNATRFGARCNYPDPNRPCVPVSHGAVVVSQSTNGGRTWSDPVLSGTPLNHPFITADLSTATIFESSGAPGYLGPLSSGDPNAPFGSTGDRWLVSSLDGVYWSTPQPFGGYTGGGAGAAAANFIPFISSAHGVLAAAFRSTNQTACGDAPTPCTVWQTTSNAGATWSRRTLPVPNTYTGGPLIAADPSTPGHFTIALLLNASTQFFVYQTYDYGNTWSEPTTLSDDATKTHVHAWLTYSPEGVLGLMWKTNEPGPGPTFAFNVWAAISEDGGATFSSPLKISRATSPAPDPGPFGTSLDALSHMALSEHSAFITWGDWRPGENSIFFSAVKLQAFKR